MYSVLIKCSVCGREFDVPPCRRGAKFCSKKCMVERQRHPIKIGEKFNRLTILREVEPEIQYSYGVPCKLRRVECLCECGNKTISRLIMVRNGDTKSCGCLKKEQDFKNLDTSTHGLSFHPIYGVWYKMMHRCYVKKDSHFHRYGGRGISVCKRWHTFELFFEDLINSYVPGLELERNNNDGNYEPNNCKWDTRKNQTNNTCRTIRVEFNGQTYPLTILCEYLGLDKNQTNNIRRYVKAGKPFYESYNKIIAKRR